MDIVLAPDVYVNASVALGSAPDQVVQRVLGEHKGESKTSEWVLGRVAAMLGAIPEFKKAAISSQMELIRGLVKVVEDAPEHPPEDWQGALVALAKTANATRVVTDHPDLLDKEAAGDIEFISTEAWLMERSMPPPPPSRPPKR